MAMKDIFDTFETPFYVFQNELIKLDYKLVTFGLRQPRLSDIADKSDQTSKPTFVKTISAKDLGAKFNIIAIHFMDSCYLVDWKTFEGFNGIPNGILSNEDKEYVMNMFRKVGIPDPTLHQSGLLPMAMKSKKLQEDPKSPLRPYKDIPLMAINHAFQASNECEHIFHEEGSKRKCGPKILIAKSKLSTKARTFSGSGLKKIKIIKSCRNDCHIIRDEDKIFEFEWMCSDFLQQHYERNFKQKNQWVDLNDDQRNQIINQFCPYEENQIMNFKVECLIPFRGKVVSGDKKCDRRIDDFQVMQRFIEESYESGDYECFRMEDEVSTA